MISLGFSRHQWPNNGVFTITGWWEGGEDLWVNFSLLYVDLRPSAQGQIHLTCKDKNKKN